MASLESKCEYRDGCRMPTRSATSRKVSPGMLDSWAASQAASRISFLVASRRSAFLSRLVLPIIVRSSAGAAGVSGVLPRFAQAGGAARRSPPGRAPAARSDAGARGRPPGPSGPAATPYGHVVTVHRMPAAEVDVSVELVRQLLAEQHADLAGLPVRVLANGWDNLVCTVGADLLARLPRRALAAELVAHEQRWLPVLAPGLPLPIPAPVRVGRPAGRFPWNWSVVPFLPGRVAALAAPADLAVAAVVLGEFLAALHVPAPPEAPVNRFRGGPLAGRASRVSEHLGLSADAGAARAIWDSAIEAAPWAGPPAWIHGDLHPANILVNAGRISAVIDFGDLPSGDPATDLSVAWMLLPAKERVIFWQAYGQADDHTRARARGWALALALAFLTHSAD